MKAPMYPTGRRVITTSVDVITSKNVIGILEKALSTHKQNAIEIEYLYNYYKGQQPILNRIKQFRPEINNKIVENHALEIVDFKKGHIFGEPVQYVARGEKDGLSDKLSTLNEFMFVEDKSAEDKELAEWFFIAGSAYRLVLPNRYFLGQEDESPFKLATLDPRYTFVVYNNKFTKQPMFGCTYTMNEDGENVYSVYTRHEYFQIIESDKFKISHKETHVLNDTPIIEYYANSTRLGAFETVLPLLDGINLLTSNRMDGVEQFVQSFLKFVNCSIDDKKFEALREMGALLVKSTSGLPADVDIISEELNQSQIQILKDDLYQAALTICSMPDRQGSPRATSDTGVAVSLRDGWTAAEVSAKDVETSFKPSDRKFLKLVLNIIRINLPDIKLSLSDIDIKFTRNRTDNFLVKVQGLQGLLVAGVHPRIALSTSGLFSDPEQVYADSLEYLEKWKHEEISQLETDLKYKRENAEKHNLAEKLPNAT